MLAELCASAGLETILVTPDPVVSKWTEKNLEQARIQTRLLQLGVTLVTGRTLARAAMGKVELACIYAGGVDTIDCATLIPVTSRLPNDALWHELKARQSEWAQAGLKTVKLIGDAYAPGIIAAAIYAGHRYARDYGAEIDPDVTPFKRERIEVG